MKQLKAVPKQMVWKIRLSYLIIMCILMSGVTYGQIIGDNDLHNAFMWILLPFLFMALYFGLPARNKRKLWRFVRKIPILAVVKVLRIFRITKT